jgi:serine/threonine protein kinase
MFDPKILNKQKSSPSLNIESEKISKGKSKTRVRFTQTNDSSFDIAAQVIAKNCFGKIYASLATSSRKFIAVKVGDKKVILNINSLASRSHLTKKEVIKIAKGKNALQTLAKEIELTQKVIENHSNLKGLLDDSIDKNMHMPTLRSGLKSAVGGGLTITTDSEKEKSLLIHAKKGKLEPAKIGKEIGKGGSATVHEIALEGQIYAYKNPDDKNKKYAVQISESIYRETNFVNSLNNEGEHEGVMLDIHLIKDYSKQGTENLKPGVLMPEYDRDYSKEIPDKPLNSIDEKTLYNIVYEFEKILSGLAYIHEKNIIHYDIKPENILIRENDGRVDISDFGLSVNTKTDPIIALAVTRGTPMFCHEKDMNHMVKLKMEAQYKKGKKQAIIETGKARDVFAAGTTFYSRFVTETPYKQDQRTYIQEGSDFIPLPDFVPQELQDLIKDMTNPIFSERITAKEAHQRIRSFRANLKKT